MSDSNAMLYDKFMTSGQAAVRLELALRGFFAPDGFTPQQHDAFGAYLRERIRPAAQLLLEREEWEQLKVLNAQGWLSRAVVEDLLTAAIAEKNTTAFLSLLQLKAEKYGFPDRDLEL